jgi:hypothetical protein
MTWQSHLPVGPSLRIRSLANIRRGRLTELLQKQGEPSSTQTALGLLVLVSNLKELSGLTDAAILIQARSKSKGFYCLAP